MSTRYRKIEVKTWMDEKFRSLSPMPASGQGLWFFLLTGPHTTAIPGLFRAGRAAMAEELSWEIEDFDEAFAEVSGLGMAKADFKSRLVWLPKAINYNKPESPNVVRGWRAELDLLPECELKREAIAGLRASLEDVGKPFVDAFDELISTDGAAQKKPSPKPLVKPSPKPSEKTMPNQEQEQEQEQEKEKCVVGADARNRTFPPLDLDEPDDFPPMDSPPPDDPASHRPSMVGAVCVALKSMGMADVAPGHQRLKTLLADGAEVQEFIDAAKKALASTPVKGFAWVLGVVARQREQDKAHAAQALSSAPPVAGNLPGFQPRRPRNRQEDLEAKNKAVADEWIANLPKTKDQGAVQ